MCQLTVSAPGKIILHGEHSVVYGYKALACTLNLRCRVTLTDSQSQDGIIICLEDLHQSKIILTKQNFELLKQSVILKTASIESDVEILKVFIKKMKLVDLSCGKNDSLLNAVTSIFLLLLKVFPSLPLVDILVSSELPVGAGLGSSAAFAVSLAAAFLIHKGQLSSNSKAWSVAERDAISSLAFQSEIVMHGQPSGIDNTVSTFGGAVVFQKGGEVRALHSFPQIRAVLVNTLVQRMTKVIVQQLRQRYDLDTKRYEQRFSRIQDIVNNVVKYCDNNFICEQEMHAKFSENIIENQSLLAELGVSHEKIEDICQLLSTMNIPGKLSGAGAGGCVFGLLPSTRDPVKEDKLQSVLKDKGFHVWITSFGAKGICVE